MAKTRTRARGRASEPIDFDEGLPSRASGAEAYSRSTLSKRRGYDVEAEVGENHARGEAGARYRDAVDFDEGLPPRAEGLVKRDRSTRPSPEDEKDEDQVNRVVEKKARTVAKKSIEVPAVLTWDAVRSGALPKLGDPGMPESLAKDVPPELRFWKCASEADALLVREALVEAGLFTKESIREVNGEPRRVISEPVTKLFLPAPADESIAVVVPSRRRAVEKAAAYLAEGKEPVTLFGEDVVEAVGIETIVEKARTLRTDWLLAVKDSPEARKVIGKAFAIPNYADLVFATSADLLDPSSVEWVSGERTAEVLKFALADDRKINLLKAKKADANGDERIVFGVVLEPDEVDAQGDTISKEEIEQAAHRFLEDFGNLGLQHKEIVNGKLKLLESFIAPVDFEVDGSHVKAGTWLMKERVVDDALWKAVKAGKFTGFSIGGSAIRKPVT